MRLVLASVAEQGDSSQEHMPLMHGSGDSPRHPFLFSLAVSLSSWPSLISPSLL